MLILGIDPGTINTGYALIKCPSPNTCTRRGFSYKLKVLKMGVIELNPSLPITIRIKKIYDSISKLISRYKPNEFVIETAFYYKNIQATLKIGYARGVSILAAVNKNVPVSEYSPAEIKKTIAGKGNASKSQIRYMIKQILGLPRQIDSKKKFDESDAASVALCHYYKLYNYQTYFKNWNDFIMKNPLKAISK